jgi:hypothetical protein
MRNGLRGCIGPSDTRPTEASRYDIILLSIRRRGSESTARMVKNSMATVWHAVARYDFAQPALVPMAKHPLSTNNKNRTLPSQGK